MKKWTHPPQKNAMCRFCEYSHLFEVCDFSTSNKKGARTHPCSTPPMLLCSVIEIMWLMLDSCGEMVLANGLLCRGKGSMNMVQYLYLRPFSVYSMGDRSWHRFCALSKEKKLKKNFRSQFSFLVGDIVKILVVFGHKHYGFGKKSYSLLSMSEEKIK